MSYVKRVRTYDPAKARAYYLANKDKWKNADGAWRKRHAEKTAEYGRRYYQKNKPAIQAKRRAKKEEFDQARDGACEICGVETRRVWDHNHTTGEFRGWLCNNCNIAIGHLRNSPELCKNAARYLESR